MKRRSALLLQIVIGCVGIATLSFLLWEPHLEGRNAHATLFQIYFKDPFLAYVYIGSIPYFVALCRAFRLFGEVREKGAFSAASLDALGVVRRCAIVLIGFVAGAVAIILRHGDGDDRPAGIFMSFLVALAASGVAIAATGFARHLRRTLNPSER